MKQKRRSENVFTKLSYVFIVLMLTVFLFLVQFIGVRRHHRGKAYKVQYNMWRLCHPDAYFDTGKPCD